MRFFWQDKSLIMASAVFSSALRIRMISNLSVERVPRNRSFFIYGILRGGIIMIEVKTQVFKLDELNPAKYNPRKKLKPGDKEFEKLKNSIKNFGYVELIVVNTANNNTAISGHQWLSVLKHLGETEAECVTVELNENDEKALNIIMNKAAGEWDEQMLIDLINDLKDADYNLDLTGFDAPEVSELLSSVHDKKIEEDNFDVDKALEAEPFVKLGDVWLLGRHRLMCGDSTKAEQVDILLDDGAFYAFHSDAEKVNIFNATVDAGFHYSTTCIWVKNSLVIGRMDYQKKPVP